MTAGGVIFHESLHAYFLDGDHANIVVILGIDLVKGTFNTVEERAVASISQWIRNGCKNKVQPAARRKRR